MLDVTLKELVTVLGSPSKQSGQQFYFRCPACSAGGGDTSCDNLLFNAKKHVLKCFACEDGAKEALRLVNLWRKDHNIDTISNAKVEQKPQKLWWKQNKENLYQYWIEAYEELNNDARRWLHNCGIRDDTIDELMIGYDENPTILNIGSCVCFPMISLNHDLQLVGFELRQIGKQKIIRHTYDAPKCLCVVCDCKSAHKLIICEGHKDAYSMLQILVDKGVKSEFTILTPAHGVDDIIDNLTGIDFNRYTSCNLLLDNDQAGDRVTEKIIREYPIFKDVRSFIKPYKDVNEYFVEKVSKRYVK